MSAKFDIVVVGGGHAGCEAAAVAARMGCRTALVSFSREVIGAMSCNPAIGGLGKGHLVREVDAFDGLIGRAADAAAIHYRMLNQSKGSAVQGPRVQADRNLYRSAIHAMLDATPNLEIVAGEVSALVLDRAGETARGVEFADGSTLEAEAVILATGTFLGGRLFRGEEREEGGRMGERAATRLAQQLRAADLPMARLKTGTPPRIDGRSIDWAVLEEQPSDGEDWTMSSLSSRRTAPQIFCAITRTNTQTHDIIRSGLDRSPLFSGAIDAQGPRYCPSIEDKIFRFGDRDGHQVFLEPEGLDTHLIYPNGISTSLPTDIQQAMVRSMDGMANAEIIVPGYAVEYDHIDPRALDSRLEVRAIPGLFCAGQINGTTGYEEAAAQGLIAGMGAATSVLETEMSAIDRANSYMAVLVDDLTLQGVTEPYRMLTSRAEYRLRLRANNASTRLTPLALKTGCVGPLRTAWFEQRSQQRDALVAALAATVSAEELARDGFDVKRDGSKRRLDEWLRFPAIALDRLMACGPMANNSVTNRSVVTGSDQVVDKALLYEIEEDARYAPYLNRQDAELRDLRANERVRLPTDLHYGAIPGLSNEMVERLANARPESLAAASRIRGITPAALAAILVFTRRSAA